MKVKRKSASITRSRYGHSCQVTAFFHTDHHLEPMDAAAAAQTTKEQEEQRKLDEYIEKYLHSQKSCQKTR
jgi:hypothetical protein